MSWFSRIREFVEEEDAKADDLDAELDNVAEALNGQFAGGSAAASEDLALTASYQDVPGASDSCVLEQAGLVLVNAVFDFNAARESVGALGAVMLGELNVDGSGQSATAIYAPTTMSTSGISGGGLRATVAQTWLLPLAPGNHTLKLRAKYASVGSGCTAKLFATHSRFSFLAVADPNP